MPLTTPLSQNIEHFAHLFVVEATQRFPQFLKLIVGQFAPINVFAWLEDEQDVLSVLRIVDDLGLHDRMFMWAGRLVFATDNETSFGLFVQFERVTPMAILGFVSA